MNYSQAIAYFNKLGNEVLTMQYDLANIRTLLKALGNPHLGYPSILIAGTNGKGSVAATLASILKAANIKAACYTSPHLINIEERIAVDLESIPREDFPRICNLVVNGVEDLIRHNQLKYRPTYFETITAMAFYYFAERKVDAAILEVGLGGRLDATNVVNPVCSIITSIALEHQQYLGNTTAQIASEKAGIIKPDSVVISGVKDRDASRVIEKRCTELNSRLLEADKICRVVNIGSAGGRYSFDLETHKKLYKSVELNLAGKHQVRNGAMVILATEILNDTGFYIEDAALRCGIKSTNWPGRIDILSRDPVLIADGAHNVEAMGALKDFIQVHVKRKIILIFGAMRDKDIKGMADIIFPLANKIILTRISSPRSEAPAEIARLCGGPGREFLLADSAPHALRLAEDLSTEEAVIVVAGSFYLVGEVYVAFQSAL